MSERNNYDRWQSESAELLLDELYECCASDGLSEEHIREIIERHQLTPHDENQVRNYRFFLAACCNANATVGVIQYLLKYFPDAANDADDKGQLPLHRACKCDDVSLGVIQLLVDAAPDSVHREDDGGHMPLHIFCAKSALEETGLLAILELFLEKYPESIRHANEVGCLPIHIAAMMSNSPKFLSVLIKAYPGSVRKADTCVGMLPLHYACMKNSVATVKYLYNLYPDAIVHATAAGMYPIHLAVSSLRYRSENYLDAVDIVEFLLGCNPDVKFQQLQELPLLVWACFMACLFEDNDKIAAAVEMTRVFCDAHPEFIREEDSQGNLPLHNVCGARQFDGEVAMAILKLLVEKYPESVRHVNNVGCLPIHIAAMVSKSLELCRLLIEAYPRSERSSSNQAGMLPIHYACIGGCFAKVQYFYNLYPAGIAEGQEGVYPIYIAIISMTQRGGADPEAAIRIVKFLLGCDPKVKLQKVSNERLSLLVWVCINMDFNDDNIGAALEIIKAIYDAHPQAIESDEMNSFPAGSHPQVQAFINSELVYSLQARDSRMMTTPDHNGQLPLHAALRNNVRLGSIKLLEKGYPLAVLSPDNSGALPLHIACMHHESASVVQYLIELDTTTLEAVDDDDNTALHYACRGAKYETITLLLEKYGAVSVSKRNAQKKLPIDLLWESNEVVDRESVEYTGSIFQLLKAHPETVMNGQKDVSAPRNGNEKKRKFGVEG